MTLIKEPSTVSTTRTLLVHLGMLFFVIFPVGVLVLLVTKFFLGLLFYGFDAVDPVDSYFWLFPDSDDDLLWRMETCTLINCTAAFVALVVFMIRALLKVGELPSSIYGIITLHVRLGFRMVTLPLLTVLVCTITSLATHFVFSGVDHYTDSYFALSMIVLLPTAIGTWIWVWRGDWITSIELAGPSMQEAEKITDTESVSHESD